MMTVWAVVVCGRPGNVDRSKSFPQTDYLLPPDSCSYPEHGQHSQPPAGSGLPCAEAVPDGMKVSKPLSLALFLSNPPMAGESTERVVMSMEGVSYLVFHFLIKFGFEENLVAF